MKKICFLITTRGNYGKTKTIIDNLAGRAEIQYIVGGGCPEMTFHGEVRRVGVFEPIEECAASLSANAVTILSELKPDVLVIVADRFECLPFAMIAFYMGIQIAHLEGGELSGSIDEGIRHAITKLASVHFPCSADAYRRILRLGENPKNVFNVGATSFDLLKEYGTNMPVFENPYLLATFHPVSSENENFDQVLEAINDMDVKTIWIQPNIDKNSERIFKKLKNAYRGFKLEEYAILIKNALCVVGNSSSGIREAPFFGTPSVNIGKRQNNRYAPQSVISVDCDYEQIRIAIQEQVDHGHYEPDYTYGDGNSGKRIADVLINNDFETQKVFYEPIGDNPGTSR
jgi:UDP-hydrolysing UDP-N-acetyl-D-glucosamine 2-epimerase